MKSSIRHIIGGFALACAVHSLAGPTLAEPPQEKAAPIPVEVFAQDPAIDDVQFSKNGSYLAFKALHDGETTLIIEDQNTGRKTIMPPVENGRLKWFRWLSDHGVLISYSAYNVRASWGAEPIFESRLAYFDFKETEEPFRWVMDNRIHRGYGYQKLKKVQTSVLLVQDNIVDFLDDDPDHVLQLAGLNNRGGIEIWRLNVKTGDHSEYDVNLTDVFRWLFDRQGKKRFGMGYDRQEGRVFYYCPSDGPCDAAKNLDWFNRGLRPVYFTETPSIAYAVGPGKAGTKALYLMNMDTGEVLEDLFVDPDHDFTEILYSDHNYQSGFYSIFDKLYLNDYWLIDLPHDGTPVGVAIQTDQTEFRFFDKNEAKLHAFLDKALPGARNIVVSRATIQKKYVVLSRTPRDAGVYYLLDLKKKSLSPLAQRRPGLPASAMAETQEIHFATPDQRNLSAYLTMPETSGPIPAVVLVHDGPDMRASADFNLLVQFLANRGYAVLQPNYRGSWGYGRAFEAAGYGEWGGLMQQDLFSSVDWLKNNGKIDGSRICIMGEGYGGYASIMALMQKDKTFACGVSLNGIVDLHALTVKYDDNGYGYLGADHLIERWTPKSGDIKDISPVHQAERVNAPVLQIVAELDDAIPPMHAKELHKKLERANQTAKLLEIDDVRGVFESQTSRKVAFEELEAFLANHLNTQVASN